MLPLDHPTPHISSTLYGQLEQVCREQLQGMATLTEAINCPLAELESIYLNGIDYLDSGDLDSALSHFSLAVLMRPQDRRYVFALACTLQQQGDVYKALTFFGYAIAMQATDPYAIFHSATCLLSLNEVDAARDALDAAILLCRGQAESVPQYSVLRKRAESLLISINR